MSRKSLTVHYRKLADPTGGFGSLSLETALRNAMLTHVDGEPISQKWSRRSWICPPSEDTLLMNIYHDDEESFFGDLTQYTTGYLQSLLRQEDNAPMLVVEQQPPPNGREYIHSMMYWMVIGNHLFCIHSRSLSAGALEKYLTWLIRDRAQVVGPETQVILDTKFDREQVGGNLEDIREIIVGGTGAVAAAEHAPTPSAPARTTETEVTRYRDVGERRSWGQRAVDVLRAVMNNEADVQQLLHSVPEGADLNVSVHIGYRSRQRRVSREPMERALRNLPEGEVTAIGRAGKLTGTDIRLSYPVRVAMNGSLLDIEDVRSKLRSAYQYFIENGSIVP